jgi:ABC-type multidrug transport system fused ATPase/permease subunit
MISTLRRFRAYIRPYRSMLVGGALLTLVDVIMSLAQPWPLRYVVDHVLDTDEPLSNGAAAWRLTFAFWVLIGLVGVGALAAYWAARLLSEAGLRIGNDLRAAVLERLQRLSLAYHGSHRVGDLVARVTSDVGATQDMLVQVLATLLPSMVLLLGMFVVMLALDPIFTLVALCAVPPLAWATHRSRQRLRLAARRTRKADGALASTATETLASIHLVQAFTLEHERTGRFRRTAQASLDAGVEAVRLQARFAPMVDVASAVSTAMVLWFGAQRVLDGRLSLGVLLVFLSYIGSLFKPIKALSKLSNIVSKGAAASERIWDVMATPREIRDRIDAIPVPVLGAIEFRQVHFSYGREQVLDGLSFRIEPGQTVALVGPTGAGKSTVAALIPRLMDPQSGCVLVDGLDVREHDLMSLRRQVAVVLQDTTLLDGTLRENIVSGWRGATAADVQRAARLALVDEFALRLPDGLDTHIGERGANLSGGQRQRVAIARAILRDAPIVILDEPTSALDAASEELLLNALDNLPPGRTRLVIAHRLSTVRDADLILVLERGRLIEAGTHDALFRSGGLYQRLAGFQAGHVRLASSAVPV